MNISYISNALPQIISPRVSAPILATIKRSSNWTTPAELIKGGYEALQGPNGKSNGDLFEGLFCAALLGSGFRYLLTSVEYKVLPYSKIDIVIYTYKGPVMISLKSSLRERWKQTDLEFGVIKNILPKTHCALVTMDTPGCTQPKGLLSRNKLLGLNQIVDCNLNSQVMILFQTIKEMGPVESFSDNILGLVNFKGFSNF